MLKIGGASRIINPPLGCSIQGQLHDRKAVSIRDNLEANAFYLSDGRTQVLLICADLPMIETPDVAPMRQAIADRTGLPLRSTIINCTQTHQGPVLVPVNFDVPKDQAYLASLTPWLAELAAEAVASARAARIGWGLGRAELGFNRRLCWADGTHTMYGDTRRPEFIGLEGPDDHRHSVLFAADEEGRPLAVAYSNSSHPTCYEAENFISSDFPGLARQQLREALGPIPVLFLNGSHGDLTPWDMLRWQPYDGRSHELRLRETAAVITAETLRLIGAAERHDAVPLRHLHRDLEVPVRVPTASQAEEARRDVARNAAQLPRFQLALKNSFVLLYDRFGANPVDALALHAVRVGDWALATNPCETYSRFGRDIKARSPAKVTALADLADGFSGYCPTMSALIGGGYSADPHYWARLAPDAGYRIVDATAALLHELWRV